MTEDAKAPTNLESPFMVDHPESEQSRAMIGGILRWLACPDYGFFSASEIAVMKKRLAEINSDWQINRIRETLTGGHLHKEAGIQITPEMIEAGGRALYEFDSTTDPHEWVVSAIYEAMERVRLRSRQ